jgi:phage/plasmid-like protein (TIGR03299 family)
MGHELTSTDSMMSVRKVPWHGLGVVLDERPDSLAGAIDAAGLNWRVEQVPVFRHDGLDGRPGAAVPGVRANVRGDTGGLLGVVSADYRVVQNSEAFAFLANLIGSELHFETAGSLWGGKAVWVLAELPDHVSVGGDEVRRFVLVTTRHDGSAAVRALVTPVRVVCANTLRVAIAGAPDVYRVRHLGDPTGALHEARRVLGLAIDYHRQFAALGDRLATERIGEAALGRVLERLYPVDPRLGERAARSRREAREAVVALFRDGPTVGNAPGSKWAAWNAIVEHHDHGGRPRTPEGGFVRRLEDPHGVKGRALELISAA